MSKSSVGRRCVSILARGDHMTRNTFSLLTGVIFLAVAVAHALRLALKWQVSVAGWDVPMWLGGVCVIAAYLAYEGFHIRKSM